MSAQDFDLSGIIVLTGLPGAGKTLRAMQIAERAVREGRPVFQCGINGFNLPGAQHWADPHAWKDLPPRAVLLVDEAQDHFRARPGSIRVPESITDMERIRHSGVCLVLTTQQPTYLDKHLRGLAQHQHLVEVLAGKVSNCYSFRSVRDDITPSSLSDAQFTAWNHPKHLYNSYKSAEVHTKKLRIPFRLKVLVAFALVVLGYIAWHLATRGDAQAQEGAAAATAAAPLQAGAPTPTEERPLTTAEYAAQLIPRLPAMPGSARIFDGRQVVSKPAVYCMSTPDSCTCLTEQGTRYEMQAGICRHLARHGAPYNPFKQPDREARQEPAGSLALSPEPPSQPLEVAISGAQMASYGEIGVGTHASASPQ